MKSNVNILSQLKKRELAFLHSTTVPERSHQVHVRDFSTVEKTQMTNLQHKILSTNKPQPVDIPAKLLVFNGQNKYSKALHLKEDYQSALADFAPKEPIIKYLTGGYYKSIEIGCRNMSTGQVRKNQSPSRPFQVKQKEKINIQNAPIFLRDLSSPPKTQQQQMRLQLPTLVQTFQILQ